MKLLLDSCIRRDVYRFLVEEEYDAIWSGEWPRDPGDLEILKRAHDEDRVLITLDKDFGELAVHRLMRHAGIIRLIEIPGHLQPQRCLQILKNYKDDLASRAILSVHLDRVRIRKPD